MHASHGDWTFINPLIKEVRSSFLGELVQTLLIGKTL